MKPTDLNLSTESNNPYDSDSVSAYVSPNRDPVGESQHWKVDAFQCPLWNETAYRKLSRRDDREA